MRVFTFDETDGKSVAEEWHKVAVDTEFQLESYLNENPTVLLDEQLLIFGRQYSLESGVPDLLGLDQYGNVVIFELKKGASGSGSASEETILSQPQRYAQSISTYEYDALNEIFHEYRRGDWSVPSVIEDTETLNAAFKAVFGSSLKAEQYNEHQRMVIVAETITRQTAKSVRYLLRGELHVQCVEVQQFVSGGSEEERVLASSTIVDYDTKRVRPKRAGNPTYPDAIGGIIDYAFPELQSLVQAESPWDVFPENLAIREPALQSLNPGHPESVSYSIRLKPLTGGTARVSLDIDNDEDALARVRDHATVFEDHGFEVSRSRTKHRVVMDEIAVKHADELRTDEFRRALADRFVELVTVGHGVFQSLE